MATVRASDARQTLPALLDRVQDGEEITITRHGRAVAVLVNPKRLRSPRAAEVWAQVDAFAEQWEAARGKPFRTDAISAERAEELVAEIRADRDAE